MPSRRKERRELRQILDTTPYVPAIKHPETGHVTTGMPGDTHYHVLMKEARRRRLDLENYSMFDSLVDEYFEPQRGTTGYMEGGSGFVHSRTGEYLTRKGIQRKTGILGESQQQLLRTRMNPVKSKIETRRGPNPAEAEKLLEKRKQTGRLLRSLGEGISRAAGNPKRQAQLLNRRGLVKAIARKNKYLGIAMAAGQAIHSYMNEEK